MTASSGVLTWVTPLLAVGGAPLSYGHLAALHDAGVTAILNLCAEFCDLHDIERDHGFEVHYLPIPDEEAPDLPALENALAWLDECIYLGKKVYIHCRHGIGRTGTVLNAYLLRRGLGHRLADRTLSKLRSRPANYCQWRAVKRYGKAAGRLSVREPRLEFGKAVDLRSFLEEYDALLSALEAQLERSLANVPRCGRDHAGCCRRCLELSLVEAVALSTRINAELTSATRLDLIDKATRMARACRLDGAEALCPLLEQERCRLFYFRPAACRLHDLPAGEEHVLGDRLRADLEQLSRQMFLALAGTFPPEKGMAFSMADVISGRYVQAFFHHLLTSTIHPSPTGKT